MGNPGKQGQVLDSPADLARARNAREFYRMPPAERQAVRDLYCKIVFADNTCETSTPGWLLAEIIQWGDQWSFPSTLFPLETFHSFFLHLPYLCCSEDGVLSRVWADFRISPWSGRPPTTKTWYSAGGVPLLPGCRTSEDLILVETPCQLGSPDCQKKELLSNAVSYYFATTPLKYRSVTAPETVTNAAREAREMLERWASLGGMDA